MLDRKLPAVCDFSVTNVCNAACDFCGFARDKTLIGERRYADADAFARALPILYRRGIRFLTLQGGEPLVHPEILRLVAGTVSADIQCAIITNGWFLPRYINSLAAAGLSRLIISIDSAELGQHERNRGLEGLGLRIAEGIKRAHDFGLPVQASVTVSRLVRYDELPDSLRRFGFDLVVFSYPRRDPFGSTSLVYGEESALVDLGRDELLAALTAIARVKKHFPVANPTASLTEIHAFRAGDIGTTMASLFRRSVTLSIWALVEELPHMRRLAHRKRQLADAGAAAAATSQGGAHGASGMSDSSAMLPGP